MDSPLIHFHFLGQSAITVTDPSVTDPSVTEHTGAGRTLPPLPTQKSRSLLAYLVCHPAPHTRSHLAGLFWPALPEAKARRRLTQALWRISSELRKEGVDNLVETTGATVGLSQAVPWQSDLQQLRQILARLKETDTPGRSELDALAQCYGGELLPGIYDDWVLVAREQIFGDFVHGMAQLLEAAKRQGDWSTAEEAVRILLEQDPLTESWVAEAMKIALTLQRPQLGLRHYEHYVARLAAELDETPGADLVALARRLAGEDKAAAANAADNTTASAAANTLTPFTDPAYQPSLIGREGERALLLEALTHAQAGQGQIVLLEGAAGVGKSRLLDVLAADAEWRRLLVGRGTCQDISLDQPYHPLIQALDVLLSPLRAQQLQVVLDPIWLAVAAGILPQLAEWLPDLPPPPALDPEPARVRVLEALTRLILALGQLAPTVLILDDLQWADSATLSALIYLSRRVADNPLLLVLAYRSEEARSASSVWVSLSEIDRGGRPRRLSLPGISAEDTAHLVRDILGLERPAPRFEHRIYTQTQGNPFFVLETLRTLYQEGNLTRSEDGGWQTPWDAQTVDYREASLSPQVESMIGRRLDQLLPGERRVLEMAAVLGTGFDLSLLSALSDGTPLQVLTATGTLVQRRFLQETATAYRFEHDQIRQTVYDQVSPTQRRQLHRRVGEMLAQVRPTAYALLAHHFEAAGAGGRAFHFHRSAGDTARAGGSYLSARHHYERAVAWVEKLSVQARERTDLLLTWETVLDLLGERERQAEILARLEDESSLPRRQQCVLALRRANLQAANGHLSPAIEAIADAHAVAADLADRPLQIEALTQWGLFLSQAGEVAEAETHLRQAVDLAEAVDDPRLHAQALIHLADFLPMRNAYAEALTVAEAARERYQALGDLAGEAHANLTLAVIAVEQGDVAGGVERYAQALTLTEECGYRYQEARIAVNMANALCILGQIGPALALYERAMAIGRELGEPRVQHLPATNYGSTYTSFVGPDDDVDRRAAEAIDWGESVGDAITVGQGWNIRSMAAYYRGDLAEARRYLDHSIAAFEEVDYAYIKAQALRAQATLCQAEADHAQALALITEALTVSRSIDAPHLVTEMASIRGEVLLSLGRLDEALDATAAGVAGADPNVFQSYLLHYRHFCALHAAGRNDEAQESLARTVDEFNSLLDSLSPEQQARSRTAIPAHAALLKDAALHLSS